MDIIVAAKYPRHPLHYYLAEGISQDGLITNAREISRKAAKLLVKGGMRVVRKTQPASDDYTGVVC